MATTDGRDTLCTLYVDSRPESIQSLALPDREQRSEGIAYSPSGNVIAVATADTNTVFLFRRQADGRFESAPFSSIAGEESHLKYPHDVSFATSGDGELMAVAQRGGAVAIFQRSGRKGTYGPAPIFEIRGPQTGLKFSDGVAFVPPGNDHLAVCNLKTNTVSFYRLASRAPVRFELRPAFELRHPSLGHPDGIGFSPCGRWLAVANHGRHTVSIFQRRTKLPWRALQYGPDPVTVLDDASLRYPHSVAFSPATNHVVVTNAGANYFSVYAPIGHGRNMRWSRSPSLHTIVGADARFRAVNACNKMEGGPKGVAIHRDAVAICSPEHGIKIFPMRERTQSPA